MNTNQLLAMNGMTRRDALRRTFLSVGGLWLAGGLAPQARAAVTPGKAKSVIQIWMWGGPCHIDTFDPKPDAGNDDTQH